VGKARAKGQGARGKEQGAYRSAVKIPLAAKPKSGRASANEHGARGNIEIYSGSW